MFGNSDGNFSVFFLGTHRKTVESRLHRDLHLAGAGYSGLDRAARTLILDRNLLARSAISHCPLIQSVYVWLGISKAYIRRMEQDALCLISGLILPHVRTSS